MSFFEKFGEKLTSAGKDVARKTKELADTAKLNMQISSEEDNIKNKYVEIGKLYYELFSSSPDDKFSEFCNSITESKNKIESLKVQIMEIKGVTKCSKCGAEIAYTATFCSSCGSPNASTEAGNSDKEDQNSEGTEKVVSGEKCDNSQDVQLGESGEKCDCSQDVQQSESDEKCDCSQDVQQSESGETSDVTDVDSAALVCPECGNTVDAEAVFCPECGGKLK